MFEIWTGHLLLAEKVVRPHQRAGRLISNSRVTESQGDEIFGIVVSSLEVSIVLWLISPRGLARFPPCFKGAHSGRLRHFGWSFFKASG